MIGNRAGQGPVTGKTPRRRSRWLLAGPAILLVLLAGPWYAHGFGTKQALEEVSRFNNLVQCCITRTKYLAAYRETAKRLQAFWPRALQGSPSVQAKAVEAVWEHYKFVASLYEHHVDRLICQDSLLAKFKSLYPSSGRDFDQGGAMMPSPQGGKCMAPQLLVPFIFRRAAKDLKQAQAIIGRSGPQE